MLRNIVMLFVFVSFIVSSCTVISKPISTKNTGDLVEEVSSNEKSYTAPKEWIYEKYDWLKMLELKELKEIEVSTPVTSVHITEQEILTSFLMEMDVHYVTSNMGSPITPEIGPYTYALKFEENTVKIEVFGEIFRSVDDPDVYYYSANDLSILGKAFLPSSELLLNLSL